MGCLLPYYLVIRVLSTFQICLLSDKCFADIFLPGFGLSFFIFVASFEEWVLNCDEVNLLIFLKCPFCVLLRNNSQTQVHSDHQAYSWFRPFVHAVPSAWSFTFLLSASLASIHIPQISVNVTVKASPTLAAQSKASSPLFFSLSAPYFPS